MVELTSCIRPRAAGWSMTRAADFRRRLERARYWAGPVLLVGGGAEERATLAALVHSEGPTRHGRLLRADARDLSRVRLGTFLRPPELDFEPGTLFLDFLEALPSACQRQLLAWVHTGPHPGGCPDAPGTRLICGIEDARSLSGPRATLLPGLVDSLDKWRIELGPWPSPPPPQLRVAGAQP